MGPQHRPGTPPLPKTFYSLSPQNRHISNYLSFPHTSTSLHCSIAYKVRSLTWWEESIPRRGTPSSSPHRACKQGCLCPLLFSWANTAHVPSPLPSNSYHWLLNMLRSLPSHLHPFPKSCLFCLLFSSRGDLSILTIPSVTGYTHSSPWSNLTFSISFHKNSSC